nr:hypothetical protein GZ31B6_2 [uncultured archaeon GZfos31B6]
MMREVIQLREVRSIVISPDEVLILILPVKPIGRSCQSSSTIFDHNKFRKIQNQFVYTNKRLLLYARCTSISYQKLHFRIQQSATV